MRLKTPRLSGYALVSAARLAQSAMGQLALKRVVRSELKVGTLAELPDSLRADMPLDTRPLQARPPRARALDDAKLPPPGDGAWAGTSETYAAAYRAGRTTPEEVVARALDVARSFGARTPTMGPMCEYADATALEEARESAARWRSRKPRGALDGVPFVVKEQISVKGLARCSGSAFVDRSPREEDATCVARLRAAGAIVLGTSVMTEFGMTPLGANAKRAMPRNPHASDCVAGGSSTGTGVAVATGLAPLGLGVDGGGSIRIPSAMCGIFGIKPTWGRVSRAGDASTGSMSHVGPLATSTLDLARALEHTGAPDPNDEQTDEAPPIPTGSLVRALGRGVRGLRIAVEEREWRDAASPIARAGEEALRVLEKEGAKIAHVQLPLARFAPSIGYVVIGVEMRASMREEWRDHKDDMTHDLQMTFCAVQEISAVEYIDALRLRAGLRRELFTMFEDADLLALPSTACTATRVTDAEMASGFVDPSALADFCRFAFLGNLSGLPCASAPVGRDASGLPIGFQLVGDAWDEATVLAATAHLERIGAAKVERPKVAVEILPA